VAEYQPILERNNEAVVKELSAMGAELTLEMVSGRLAEAEDMLATIKRRIPTTVRLTAAAHVLNLAICFEFPQFCSLSIFTCEE
jgi:hypothetical protein